MATEEVKSTDTQPDLKPEGTEISSELPSNDAPEQVAQVDQDIPDIPLPQLEETDNVDLPDIQLPNLESDNDAELVQPSKPADTGVSEDDLLRLDMMGHTTDNTFATIPIKPLKQIWAETKGTYSFTPEIIPDLYIDSGYESIDKFVNAGIMGPYNTLISDPINATWKAAVASQDLIFGLGVKTLRNLGMSRTEARQLMRDIAIAGEAGMGTAHVTKIKKPLGADSRYWNERMAIREQVRERAKLAAENQAAARKTEIERAKGKEIKGNDLLAKLMESDVDINSARAVSALDRYEDVTIANRAELFRLNAEDVLFGKDAGSIWAKDILTPKATKHLLKTLTDYMRANNIKLDTTGDPVKMYKQVHMFLAAGELDYNGFKTFLAQNNLSVEDFANMYGRTVRTAGQTLREQRRFKDDMDAFRSRALQGDDDAVQYLSDLADMIEKKAIASGKISPNEISATESMGSFFQASSRTIRQLIVSMPATAVRNMIESGGIRQIWQVADTATEAALRKLLNPNADGNPIKGWGELYRLYTVGGTVKSTRALNQIMKAWPEQYNRLFGGLEADPTGTVSLRGGKWPNPLDKPGAAAMHALLTFNRVQSRIVRRATFTAALERNLKSIGSSLEDVTERGMIPNGMNKALADAIDEALYVDFSMPINPRKGGLESIMNGYATVIEGLNKFGNLGMLVDAFPRFFYNFLKFHVEHSPTFGMRMMSPKARAKMAEGDFSDMSKEMVGTAALGFAMAIRAGQIPGIEPGEAWDEIKVSEDGTTISLKPLASLAPYMFVADLVVRIEDDRLKDTANVVNILREIKGTAPQLQSSLVSVNNIITATTGMDGFSDASNALDRFSQTMAESFMRPLQTVLDFRAEFNESLKYGFDAKGESIAASVVKMVDPTDEVDLPMFDENLAEALGYKGGLPRRYLPTRSEPIKNPDIQITEEYDMNAGLFSQFTGFKPRMPRNAIESELTKFDFTAKSVNPKVKDKRIRNFMSYVQGPILERFGETIVTSRTYLAMTNDGKRRVLANLIKFTRQPAIDAVKQYIPTAAAMMKADRIPVVEFNHMAEQFDILLEDRGASFRSEDAIRALKERAEKEIDKALNNLRVGDK